MKGIYICGRCAFDSRDDPARSMPTLCYIEITGDVSSLAIMCERHGAAPLVDRRQFELLFDMGAMAFLDGYYRESVTAFAASLERFFEFFVHTICSIRKLDRAQIAGAWKSMAKQSERQLGAFIACHLLDAGTAPALLAVRPHVELRNEVTHNGYLPKRAEALAYGEAVRANICSHLRAMQDRHRLATYLSEEAWAKAVQVDSFAQPLKRHLLSADDAGLPTFGSGTLEESLQLFDKIRGHLYTR